MSLSFDEDSPAQAASQQQEASMMLLSDLCNILPIKDVYFDFQVADMSLKKGVGAIGILIDNNLWSTHHSMRCLIPSLRPGYHLLRAFLIDESSNTCVKAEDAYIEAEFFVGNASSQLGVRPFMFGQPSICVLSPRNNLIVGEPIRVEYFVSNCEVSSAPHGFGVRVYVNDVAVTTLRHWRGGKIVGGGLAGTVALGRTVRVRCVLLNPAGEEVLRPAYNCETLRLPVLSAAAAAAAAAAAKNEPPAAVAPSSSSPTITTAAGSGRPPVAPPSTGTSAASSAAAAAAATPPSGRSVSPALTAPDGSAIPLSKAVRRPSRSNLLASAGGGGGGGTVPGASGTSSPSPPVAAAAVDGVQGLSKAESSAR